MSLVQALTNNSETKNLKHLIMGNEQSLKPQLVVEKTNETLAKCHTLKDCPTHELIEQAIHWCLVNGFVLVPKERAQHDLMVVTYMPFNLFPVPFKKCHYNQVMNLQPHVNEVIYKISTTPHIIKSALGNLIKIDRFLATLWFIYRKAMADGYNQKINFTIIRCDYMLNELDGESQEKVSAMKQVEINTIAAGFGYVSTKMTQLHKEILKWTKQSELISLMPSNEPLTRLAQGFVQAWRLYDNEDAIVVFLVCDVEINIADQRHLEYEIVRLEPKIVVRRCTLNDIYQNNLTSSDFKLMYDNQEVAVVYFRAGYAPSHYRTINEWEALLKIESSKAIKCPSVGSFLAGMKKFQEFMTVKENLDELCNYDISMANSLEPVFAKFPKLDQHDNFEKILKNPHDYVIKPQREGGGNNYFGSDIVRLLSNMKLSSANKKEIIASNADQSLELAEYVRLFQDEDEDIYNIDRYICMEFLRPAETSSYLISPKNQQNLYKTCQTIPPKVDITNEMGIFGVLVRDENQIYLNEACGYCLRSKPTSDNECGVMCGAGALNTIYFID